MKNTSKKVIGLTACAVIALSLLAACGNSSSASKSDSKTISDLKISFIPSKNPDDITTVTKPIANILKSELKKQGYTVKKLIQALEQTIKRLVKDLMQVQLMSDMECQPQPMRCIKMVQLHF